MAAASVRRKLDELLQCSICGNIYSDPRALPCLHTFCCKCIEEKCKDKQPGENAPCPLCRKEFAIPEIGITNLEKSPFIRNLLNIDELKNSETEIKLCDICEGDEERNNETDSIAKQVCLECQQNLCASCSVVHTKLKHTSLHKLLNLNRISKDVDVYKHQTSLCDKHGDRQIEAYCFDCETTMCMMCYIKDHSSHKISDLVEVVGDFSTDLKQDIQNMNAAISKLDKNLRVIQSRRVSFCETIKKVETAIFDKTEQLKAMIEAEKQKLLAELSEIKGSHEQELENLIQEMTQDKSLLKNYKKYCTELLQKGTTADITREARKLHSRSEELGNVKNVEEALKNTSVGNVIFLPSGVTYSETSSILGQVVKKGPKPGIPTMAHTLPETYGVTGLALLDEDVFITRSNASNVSVFNSVSLQLKRQVPVAGFSAQTYGLAACSTNRYLYVSDYQQHCVHRLDLALADANPAVIRFNVHQQPAGLSVNRNSNVLVAYQTLKKVQEYTPNGYLVREVSDGVNNLWQAVGLNNDTLVVYGTGPRHGISKMTMDGRVLRCYGNQPAGGAVNVTPATRPFAIDSEGNIMVAIQEKHQILVINSSLTDAYPLQLPANIGFQSPSGLCYDQSRGLLYVAEYGGQNRLLVFSNVTNISALFNSYY